MPKPVKKSQTQTRKTHRFRSFTQRLELVDTDVLHTSSTISGPLEDLGDAPCHFLSEVLRWNDLNLTENFQTFMRRVVPISQSLAQLLHHKDRVVELLLKHIPIQPELSLQALLDCTAAFARDLQQEFHPYFPKFAQLLFELLDYQDPDILEAVFATFAYLFKFLLKYLIKDFEGTIRILSPLFDHKKWYVRRFSAEVVSFLIRKIPHAQMKARIKYVLDCKGCEVDEAAVDGLGQLLFDSIQGVKREFHSKADTIVHAALSCVDFDAGEDFLYSRLSLVRRMLYLSLEHCRANTAGLLWKALADVTESVMNSDDDMNDDGNKMVLSKGELCVQVKSLIVLAVMAVAHRRGLRVTDGVRTTMYSILGRLSTMVKENLEDENVHQLSSAATALALGLIRTTPENDVEKSAKHWSLGFEFPLDASLQMAYELAQIQSSSETLHNKIMGLCDAAIRQNQEVGALVILNTLAANNQEVSLGLESLHVLMTKTEFPLRELTHLESLLPSSKLFILIKCCGLLSTEACAKAAVKLIASVVKKIDTLLSNANITNFMEADRAAKFGVALLVECCRSLRRLRQFLGIVDTASANWMITQMLTYSKQWHHAVEEAHEQLSALILDGGHLSTSRKVLVDSLAANLSLPEPDLRLNTLKFLLCLYKGKEHQEMEEEDGNNKKRKKNAEKAKKKMKAEENETTTTAATTKTDDSSEELEVLQLMLDIEESPLDAIQGKQRVNKIQVLGTKVGFDQIPTALLGLATHHFIGQLRTRFSLLWPVAVEGLGAVLSRHPILFWQVFQAPFEHTSLNWRSAGEREVIMGSEDVLDEEHLQPKKKKSNRMIIVRKKPKNGTIDSIFDWDAAELRVMESINVWSNLAIGDLVGHALSLSHDGTDYCETVVHMLQVIAKSSSSLARNKAAICSLFFKFLGIEEEDDASVVPKGQTGLGTSNGLRVICQWLDVFSKAASLKVFTNEKKFKAIFIELLSRPEPRVQRRAFECLLIWKLEYLAPYSENIRRLINNTTFRDELSFFSVDSVHGQVVSQHRAELMPIITRILYTKILQRGGSANNSRRRMVMAFLAALSASELESLFTLSLSPFVEVIRCAEAGDVMKAARLVTGVATKKRLGFLQSLEDMIKQLGSGIVPFLPRILHILMAIVRACYVLEEEDKVEAIEEEEEEDDDDEVEGENKDGEEVEENQEEEEEEDVEMEDAKHKKKSKKNKKEKEMKKQDKESKDPKKKNKKNEEEEEEEEDDDAVVEEEEEEEEAAVAAHKALPTHGDRKSRSKIVRRHVLRRISEILEKFTNLQGKDEFVPALLDCIMPQILKLSKERVEKSVGLLDMIKHLSVSPHLSYFLFCNNDILPAVFQILSNAIASLETKLAALQITAELISPESPVKEKFVPFIPIFLDHASQSLESVVSDVGAVSKERRENVKFMSQLFDVLSVVSTYPCSPSQAEKLLDLMLPFLVSRSSGYTLTDEQKMFVLDTATNLLPMLGDASKYANLLGRQLINLMSRDLRSAVSRAIAAVGPSTAQMSEMIVDMNAMMQGMRDDEIDWDRRLAAYAKVKRDFVLGLTHESLVVLCCQALYDVQDEEIAGRSSAVNALSVILEALAPELNELHKGLPSHLYKAKGNLSSLLHGLILMNLRRFLSSGSANVRTSVIGLIGVAAKHLKHVFPDLHALGKEEDDSGFFTNLTHIQIHRRGRAMQKLTKFCGSLLRTEGGGPGEEDEADQLKAKKRSVLLRPVIARNYLLPVAWAYALDPRGNIAVIKSADSIVNLQHDAMHAIGALSKILTWDHYFKLVKAVLRELKEKPSIKKGKVLVKILCSVLDGFHFEVTAAEDANPEFSMLPIAVATDEMGFEEGGVDDDDEFMKGATTTAAAAAAAAAAANASNNNNNKKKSFTEEIGEEDPEDPLSSKLFSMSRGIGLDDDEEEEDEDGNNNEEEEQQQPARKSRRLQKLSADLPEFQGCNIFNALTQVILPSVFSNMREPRTGDESKDGGVRTTLALAAVRILKLLPEKTMEKMVPHLVRVVCTALCSRSYRIRQETTQTLANLAQQLGPSFLPHFCRELKSTLVKGFMVHVLGHAMYAVIHAVGSHCGEGYLQEVAELVLGVYLEEIQGDLSEEKKVSAISSKIPEAKTSKAAPAMKALGQYCDLKCINDLIVPELKMASRQTETLKQRRKIQELLMGVIKGIEKNTSIQQSNLLMFVHQLVKTHIRSFGETKLPPLKQDEDNQHTKHKLLTAKKEDSRLIPESWTLPRLALKKIEDEAVREGDTHPNDFVILEFALYLLSTILRKTSMDFKDKTILEMLDPFVVLIFAGMRSKYITVMTQSIKILSVMIELPLPTIQRDKKAIIELVFRLIQKSSVAQSDATQACFKLLSILLRNDASGVTTNQAVVLLSWIKEDLEHPKRHSSAFQLLRALSAAKILLPEMYDLMNNVGDVLVRSQSQLVRQQSCTTLVQFLMDLPMQNNRIDQHIHHLITNLSYDYEDGRVSVIDTLSIIVNKFPEEVLHRFCDTMIPPLISRLSLDDSEKCRRMIALLVKAVVHHSGKPKVDGFIRMGNLWLENGEDNIKSSGLQLLRLIAEQLGKKCVVPFTHTLTLLKDMFNTIETHADTDEMDMAVYNAVVLTEKLAPHIDPSNSHIWPLLLRAVTSRNVLLHHFAWVRMGAARLVGNLLSLCSAPEEFKKTKLYICNKDNEEGALANIVRCHCTSLTSTGLESKLGDQIIKNLVFVSAVISEHPKLFHPTSTSTTTDNEVAPAAATNGNNDNNNNNNNNNVDDEEMPAASEATSGFQWLIRRISWIASRYRNVQRATCLRFLAAVTIKLGRDKMLPVLFDVVAPVYRALELSQTEHDADACMTLAREALGVIEGVVGTTEFFEEYNKHRALASARKTAKKHERSVAQVINPQRMLAEKAARIEREKRKKKEKIREMKKFRGVGPIPKREIPTLGTQD